VRGTDDRDSGPRTHPISIWATTNGSELLLHHYRDTHILDRSSCKRQGHRDGIGARLCSIRRTAGTSAAASHASQSQQDAADECKHGESSHRKSIARCTDHAPARRSRTRRGKHGRGGGACVDGEGVRHRAASRGDGEAGRSESARDVGRQCAAGEGHVAGVAAGWSQREGQGPRLSGHDGETGRTEGGRKTHSHHRLCDGR